MELKCAFDFGRIWVPQMMYGPNAKTQFLRRIHAFIFEKAGCDWKSTVLLLHPQSMKLNLCTKGRQLLAARKCLRSAHAHCRNRRSRTILQSVTREMCSAQSGDKLLMCVKMDSNLVRGRFGEQNYLNRTRRSTAGPNCNTKGKQLKIISRKEMSI